MSKRFDMALEPRPTLAQAACIWILGVDLAWGDRNGDGLCLIKASRGTAHVLCCDYSLGDDALVQWINLHVPKHAPLFIALDAPMVIANETGTRPVDRLTHRMFHRQHAACHPANRQKCPRPLRLMERLYSLDINLGWDLTSHARLAAEVYPHPAMVRLFRLTRIIKYKKGTVAERRIEFSRLQSCLQFCLGTRFPDLRLNEEAEQLLVTPWKKPVEDRVDAFFCALIGYHHWIHNGLMSEVIGDLQTGFILLPAE